MVATMIKPDDKTLLQMIGDSYNNDDKSCLAFSYLCMKYAFRLNPMIKERMQQYNISKTDAMKSIVFDMKIGDSMVWVMQHALDLQSYIRSKNDLLNW
jgi:hypothetical protein